MQNIDLNVDNFKEVFSKLMANIEIVGGSSFSLYEGPTLPDVSTRSTTGLYMKVKKVEDYNG